MVCGAVILCGGRSSRMGRDKAMLPFGDEQLLQRVVRLVSQAVDPANIVVVAASDQPLPPLPAAVTIAHDLHPERGPLEGLAAGLSALPPSVDAVYATACDVPFLAPALVARMFELLGEHEVAVPRDGAHHHPLAAVYRMSVLPTVQRLLVADRLSMRSLFSEVATREVDIEQLRDVDSTLATLQNINRPEDYQVALVAAGFA